MATTHQSVERPAVKRARPGWAEAFLETATTGKAIRVPLSGRHLGTMRASVFAIAARRGLHAHTRVDGDDALIIWCEDERGTS